jgi:hypothetical protein
MFLARECHALLDLSTINLDGDFVANFAGEPADVLVIETAAEDLFDAL